MKNYPKRLSRDGGGMALHMYGDIYTCFIEDSVIKFCSKTYKNLVSLGFKEKLKDCKIAPAKKTNNPCRDDE